MFELDNFSTVLPKCGRFDLFSFFNELKETWCEAEVQSILKGFRNVAVCYLNSEFFDEQLGYLSDKGLLFSPLVRVKSFDDFGHKHEVVEKIDGDTSIYGVISKSTKCINKFKDYYFENNDFGMGIMLGYPECCSRAFSDYVKRSPDPIFEIAKNTPSSFSGLDNAPWMRRTDLGTIEWHNIPWMLQSHLRYFGLRIIPFIPCSFLCDEAQKVAKEWHKLLKEINPSVVDILEELMTRDSVWDLYNAQVVVNGPPFPSEFVGYATSAYYPERRRVEFYWDKDYA
jgi:hypothetical protein